MSKKYGLLACLLHKKRPEGYGQQVITLHRSKAKPKNGCLPEQK
jgi:hypothetical protein